MVLGHILTCATAILAARDASQLSIAEGLVRARSFAELAARGAFGQTAGTPPDLRERSVERTQDIVTFILRGPTVSVNLQRNEVIGFVDTPEGLTGPWTSSQALDAPHLVILAKAFHASAGHSGEIRHWYTSRAYGSNYIPQFQVTMLRTYEGVPYTQDYGIDFLFEHSSGRLMMYMQHGNGLPAPPTTLVPLHSADLARARMVQEVLRLRPSITSMFEFHPVRLALWKPAPQAAMIHSLYSPDCIQAARENRAVLVYWGFFHANWPAEEGFETPRTRPIPPGYEVFFDAISGRVLAIGTTEGVLGVGSRRSRRRPFDWNIGPCAMTVSSYRKTATATGARVDLVRRPAVVAPGHEILLTVARLSLRCLYHPGSGLLSIDGNEAGSYGRPSPPLLKAIRAVMAERPR